MLSDKIEYKIREVVQNRKLNGSFTLIDGKILEEHLLEEIDRLKKQNWNLLKSNTGFRREVGKLKKVLTEIINSIGDFTESERHVYDLAEKALDEK